MFESLDKDLETLIVFLHDLVLLKIKSILFNRDCVKDIESYLNRLTRNEKYDAATPVALCSILLKTVLSDCRNDQSKQPDAKAVDERAEDEDGQVPAHHEFFRLICG